MFSEWMDILSHALNLTHRFAKYLNYLAIYFMDYPSNKFPDLRFIVPNVIAVKCLHKVKRFNNRVRKNVIKRIIWTASDWPKELFSLVQT